MISTRFAAWITLLTSFALVPTVIHTYLDVRSGASVRLQDLTVKVDGDPGASTSRQTEWALRKFASDDWQQRSYFGGDVVLTIVRTYDPKRVYHHPELAVAYPDEYAPATSVQLPGRPDVPVHVLSGENQSADRRSMYVLEYGGTFVTDPVAFQIRNSLASLFSARKPMTLIYVHERAQAQRDAPQSSRGARVLAAALDELARSSDPAADR